MSVHFAYRCPYAGPPGLFRKTFPDPTVLDWFRARWDVLADPDEEAVWPRVAAEMGCTVYSFASLFHRIATRGWPAPGGATDLREAVDFAVYNEEVRCPSPHALEVLTDDDEVGLAYWFFDDDYRARYPGRVAFLLQEGWELPEGAGHEVSAPAAPFLTTEPTELLGPERAGGAVYFADLDHGGDLGDELVRGARIEGVRLPGLARHLLASPPPSNGNHFVLDSLRRMLAFAPPGACPLEQAFHRDLLAAPDGAAWNAYSDWLQEQGRPPVGEYLLRHALVRVARAEEPERPATDLDWAELDDLGEVARAGQGSVDLLDAETGGQSLFQFAPHLVQACCHVASWQFPAGEDRIFHRWIFFDDVWAAEFPELGSSILRYAGRWDVLSDG